MLSSALKRSVAAVGVAAGLLVAAGPASAQMGPSTNGVTTPRTGPQVAHPGLKADSNEVAVEALGMVTNNNDLDLPRFGGHGVVRRLGPLTSSCS